MCTIKHNRKTNSIFTLSFSIITLNCWTGLCISREGLSQALFRLHRRGGGAELKSPYGFSILWMLVEKHLWKSTWLLFAAQGSHNRGFCAQRPGNSELQPLFVEYYFTARRLGKMHVLIWKSVDSHMLAYSFLFVWLVLFHFVYMASSVHFSFFCQRCSRLLNALPYFLSSTVRLHTIIHSRMINILYQYDPVLFT